MPEISMYQVEMVRRNIIKGIIKMSVSDGELKYDMSGLKPLKRIGFFHMIKIVDIIKRACMFFLYEKNFVLGEGKIHTNKKNEIRMIYVPVKKYSNKTMNFEAFIRNNIKARYLQDNIINYTKSDSSSYFAFNAVKIAYVMTAAAFSVSMAALFSIYFIFSFILFFILPVIRMYTKESNVRIETDDRTIILSERDKITVCFSDIFGNEKSICIREHESKYVGRDNKECSLYICNNAVGRKHARLTYAEGKVLVSDNDSLNSTYINNQKLKKNMQYEIKDGDKVMFANEEYMLFLKKQ